MRRLSDERLAAAIFDLDVVVDGADRDAAAWRSLFETVPPLIVGGDGAGSLQTEEYRTHLHGRPSEEGLRALVAARGLAVPEGRASDPPGVPTIHGLAARQREIYAELLAADGVVPYPSTLRLLERLRSAGVRTAVVAAARAARTTLADAGTADLFDAVVEPAEEAAVPRTAPTPEMFREAAHRLAVAPRDAVVFQDSADGVRAAAVCGFGRVIGVDRGGNRATLRDAGADVVVNDPASVDALAPAGGATWRDGADIEAGPWILAYNRYDPATEGFRETLCTLANGYWGTRGAAPSAAAGGGHYPGTYLAGVYDRLDSEVSGTTLHNESIVNIPNWLPIAVRHADGTRIDIDHGALESYRQELDLRRGMLTCSFVHRDPAGRTTRITQRRIVSVADPHLAALQTTIEAVNWSGAVRVCAALDGGVANVGVAEYRRLASQHLQPIAAAELDDGTLLLEMVTRQSRVHIALAARTRASAAGGTLDVTPDLVEGAQTIGHDLALELSAGTPVTVEKVVAVASSRDWAISTPAEAARFHLSQAGDFAALLAAHERRWAGLWDDFAVDLVAGAPIGLALNLHIFHVLQTVIGTNVDAGIPARGYGEGYHGHVFWDEMFVYPMLTLRRPELTRNLLAYRYRRLPAARAAAAAAGLPGALFPWQSGGDGRDVTPRLTFNPVSGRWRPDTSHRQRHVGLAIAYSVIQYHEATADTPFLTEIGGELLVEICRLFAALPTYDPTDDRFHIDAAMGPDEFHDGYPGQPGRGVRDNAYTNVLTAWLLNRTIGLLDTVDRHDCGRLRSRLGVTATETAHWELLSRRLAVPWHSDGVISQFEGYESLPDLDWSAYRARYGNIRRLELILDAEGDSANNYRIGKQADVLMLFYLFSAEELRDVLARLGYALPPEAIRATVDFYTARTSHGSTLSRIVHAWVNARADRRRASSLFTEAMAVDLADPESGTTVEGVHLAAMAGTVDMIVRCFSGIETRDDALWLHALLPPEVARAQFTITYRRQPVMIEITPQRLRLRLPTCDAEPICVCVDGERFTLRPGDVHEARVRPAR